MNALYRAAQEEIGRLAEGLVAGLAEEAAARVRLAIEFASQAHAGQTRDEGTPYIIHPLRVATLLRHHGYDDAGLLAAAVLHDVVEDCEVTLGELRRSFGPRVAALVESVTKPSLPYPYQEDAYQEQLQHASEEARLIKVADRLDNLAFLHLSPSRRKQQRYLTETHWFYLSFADDVGGPLADSLHRWWESHIAG